MSAIQRFISDSRVVAILGREWPEWGKCGENRQNKNRLIRYYQQIKRFLLYPESNKTTCDGGSSVNRTRPDTDNEIIAGGGHDCSKNCNGIRRVDQRHRPVQIRCRRRNTLGEIAYDTTAYRQNCDINATRMEAGLHGKPADGQWTVRATDERSPMSETVFIARREPARALRENPAVIPIW